MNTRRLLAILVLVGLVTSAGCAGFDPSGSFELSMTPTAGSETTTTETTPRTTVTTGSTPETTADSAVTTASTTTSSTTTPTTTTPSTTTPTTAATTRTPTYATGSSCTDAWVSLWGLPTPEFWASDSVRVGFNLGPDATALLVVEANGSVVGVESVVTDGSGIDASGYVIRLDRTLEGTQSIQVTVYADRNADGDLDTDVDRPCYAEYGPVETGTKPIDFDRFDENDA